MVLADSGQWRRGPWGWSIVGFGLEDELRQPTFAIGLKGVEREDIAKVEALIFDTIAKIAEDGFTQVGPGGYCPTLHPTHFEPSIMELNGIL